MKLSLLLAAGLGLSTVEAKPTRNPYSKWASHGKRQGLTVDLGYERYAGHEEQGLDVWKGVRFAASTGGENRFQPPKVPSRQRRDVILASDWGSQCIQPSGDTFAGSEDCLFLNVHAPKDAKNLPVFVFIHGGAYQLGYGALDPIDFILNNNQRFVTVFIQYRLDVMGFLSSPEIRRHGALNAGLLDMEMSLQWVQNYIHLFGGNPHEVTISGESAGGGAVMLMSMLRGGKLGNSLFKSVIGASPYLPRQPSWNDEISQGRFHTVANYTGCLDAYGGVFDCLVKTNASVLIDAGKQVDGAETMQNWGFAPVTDGILLHDVPSRQLRRKQVNGERMLVGNNANEGPLFTPQTINTSEDFDAFTKKYYSGLSKCDLKRLKKLYPEVDDTNSNVTNYATYGNKGATANSISTWGNGQQQRANNMQAETVFICPAYWMAEAFPHGWKYEFAAPPAFHSFDVNAYFFSNQTHPDFTDDFVAAFQNVWGDFIVNGDPRISKKLACGSNCTASEVAHQSIREWHSYSREKPTHLVANVTGGVPATYNLYLYAVPWSVPPGLVNDFRVTNAYSWEGGRGERCDFWQEVGHKIPG